MSIWFKHDAHFHEHPKCIRLRRLAGTKSDTAEVGWWRIVAAAKRSGRWFFEDEEHLRDASGRYYGFVSLYRQVGLLDDLTIHDGEEYQSPLSGAERQAKLRYSRNAGSVTPDVTGVTPRVEKSRESRTDKRHASRYALLEELTGRPASTAGDRQVAEYDRHFEDYPAKVEAAYRKAAKAFTDTPTARQLVWAARNILEPFAKPDDIRKLEERERSDAEQEAYQRRLEATRRKAEELRRASGE